MRLSRLVLLSPTDNAAHSALAERAEVLDRAHVALASLGPRVSTGRQVPLDSMMINLIVPGMCGSNLDGLVVLTQLGRAARRKSVQRLTT